MEWPGVVGVWFRVVDIRDWVHRVEGFFCEDICFFSPAIPWLSLSPACVVEFWKRPQRLALKLPPRTGVALQKARLCAMEGEGRSKLRRLENRVFPDDEDTESNAGAEEQAAVQREIHALKLEIKILKKKLAQEREESDTLRTKLAEMSSQLDFVRKCVAELSRSVASFGAMLILNGPDICQLRE